MMSNLTNINVSAEQFDTAVLAGAIVYDGNDEKVGEIAHLHGTGLGSEVVLDIQQSFTLARKLVAVPMSALSVMRDINGKVFATTALTAVEVANLKEHIED